MKTPITCLYGLLGFGSFAGSALAADTAMPPDVAALAWRDVQCREWSNVAITDAATDYRVEHALVRLKCDRLAADIVALRRKYMQSPPALEALDAVRDIAP
jgi:hypothetical protein